MSKIVIHIGAPRTGTTVIQKYATNKLINHICLQKQPQKGSGALGENGIAKSKPENVKKIINEAKTNPQTIIAHEFWNHCIVNAAYYCSQNPKITKGRETYFPFLCQAFEIIKKHSEAARKNIFISTERFSDTSSALTGYSTHKQFDSKFPIYAICEATKESLTNLPLISVALRSPIPYLRSKFIRTFFQRRSMQRERDLSPAEFIQKQCTLESNHPGTSALTPAMHAEFIKQLKRHAFVKAFGFQELLASDDVFSLMGLQGEGKYAFRDFPRENKLPFTKEQEQAIEIEITQALKKYSFYDRIMKAQMFE